MHRVSCPDVAGPTSPEDGVERYLFLNKLVGDSHCWVPASEGKYTLVSVDVIVLWERTQVDQVA